MTHFSCPPLPPFLPRLPPPHKKKSPVGLSSTVHGELSDCPRRHPGRHSVPEVLPGRVVRAGRGQQGGAVQRDGDTLVARVDGLAQAAADALELGKKSQNRDLTEMGGKKKCLSKVWLATMRMRKGWGWGENRKKCAICFFKKNVMRITATRLFSKLSMKKKQ